MERVRVIIRGFLGKTVVFENKWNLEPRELSGLLPDLADSHATDMLAGKLSMIEIEFPDDPEEERFFRIGVDASGMVMPIEIAL